MNYVKHFRLLITRKAIECALKRAPVSQSSDLEDGPPRDKVMVYLFDQDGKRRFIVQAIEVGGVSGLAFDPASGTREPGTLSDVQLTSMATHFAHDYHNAHFRYKSPYSFIFAILTQYSKLRLFLDRKAQDHFNRKPLVRNDRLRVLELFFEKAMERTNYHPSVVDIVADLHTIRSVDHPRYEQTENYYELLLESLVQQGDLIRDNARYSISPTAITTLQTIQGERERHQDNINQQRRIGLLTLALVVTAVIQVGVAIWSEIHPDPASPVVSAN